MGFACEFILLIVNPCVFASGITASKDMYCLKRGAMIRALCDCHVKNKDDSAPWTSYAYRFNRKITMWEDIGVHNMDQTRPHKLQSLIHKTCGSTQSCVPIDLCHNFQSYPGREIVRRGHKGTDHDRPSLEVHYKDHPLWFTWL
jgi:hypothetical protein